jgi:hypothetical protein
MNSFRSETKQDISGIKSEINELRSEMKTYINTIQAEIASLRLWSIGTVVAIFIAAVGWLITWIAAKP